MHFIFTFQLSVTECILQVHGLNGVRKYEVTRGHLVRETEVLPNYVDLSTLHPHYHNIRQ